MTSRRELRLAVLLCLVGSGLVLLGVRHSWLTFVTSDDLTIKDVTTGVRGSSVAGLAQALSLVGLAGVAALAATRGLGRVLVGVLLALAGLGVVGDLVRLMTDGLGHRLLAADCPGRCIVSQEQYDSSPLWLWPVLALVGGVLLLLGGLLVSVRGRRWAALGSSYQVPAARAAEAPVTDKAVWDALDEGHDPTA